MTEQEKNERALDIVNELATATQETRDAWREKSLAQQPQNADFIEQAYKLASKNSTK